MWLVLITNRLTPRESFSKARAWLRRVPEFRPQHVAVHSYPLSTEKGGTRGTDIQGHPWLHSGLESSLVCVRLCLLKMQQ